MSVSDASRNPLALLGGPRAVTITRPERWRPPIEREIELCTQVIRERSFSKTDGPIPTAFERRFREISGCEYVLPQNNGTSTLLAAYFAIGVGPGDEIITPSYGWICTFGPAMLLGARPVFCEVDPDTLLADPADVERRITPRTRAVCVPHLFGNVCDMDRVMAVAERHGVAVVEDCSHAHGARWRGRPVGSIGRVGCFSLQGAAPGGKPVAGGEAGVVATNDRRCYERVLAMGHLNRAGMARELTDPALRALAPTGLALAKFRADALSLAIALASAETLEYRNERIWNNYQRLEQALAGVPGIRLVSRYAGATPAGFYGNMRGLYDPAPLGGLPLPRFVEAVQAEGAELGGRSYDLWHLNPLFTRQTPFWDTGGGPLTGDFRPYSPGSLPVTEECAGRTVAFPRLIDPEPGFLDQYAAAIRKVAAHASDLV